MEPTINTWDLVITKPAEKNCIKEGDIKKKKKSEISATTITHRVVNITEENGELYYETKGDNNNSSDETPVKYDNVEGIYALRIKKIGKFFMKLKNGSFIIMLVIVVYIIYRIIDRKVDMKKIRHQKRERLEQDKNEKNFSSN